MKHVLALALGLLLLAAPAFAHDADGKWEGMIDTPMGTIPVGFTFKADGAALSGTSLGPDGAGIPIKNGESQITYVEATFRSAWQARLKPRFYDARGSKSYTGGPITASIRTFTS